MLIFFLYAKKHSRFTLSIMFARQGLNSTVFDRNLRIVQYSAPMFSNVSRLHCCLAFAPCVLITFFQMQEKVVVSKPAVQLKQIQNKSLMCKPIMMTKATSCNPIRIHKVTQTGLLSLCFYSVDCDGICSAVVLYMLCLFFIFANR